ncbi:hypothetical protein AJ80_05112 [Polytolypa hystricis UAMH7299]|uniref:Enoyl reductase (ER) domain-containing protein n=1 Tax=Polytolypa hystricis (strain UAMH7299) TaxID=1447883 RepID=A0A2B7Y859_POLH7|nr:hypothetical protein AJ80_05112 [Polytolypa hystricis UAMH7299]
MPAAIIIPPTQTAITQHEGGMLKVAQGVPIAEAGPGWLLVRNETVALNPCDFKMAARFPTPGLLDGVDFAGTVIDAGPDSSSGFHVGDRVFGCVPGNKQDDPESGSFCEFVKVEAIYAWKIPEDMSFETASALCAACIVTIGLTMHQCFKMEVTRGRLPDGRPRGTVLVYGGSSSVGLVAIQLLKICGYEILTTCSPRNFDLVKQYGADVVFDYHSPTCAADIKKYTKNALKYVIDPFGEVNTLTLCYKAIGRAGGIYCALEQYQESLCTRRTVKHHFIMGPSVSGRGVVLPEPYGVAPDPELHEWSKEFYRVVQVLVDDGSLKSLPIQRLPGRFEGILKGLDILKNKQVSGAKLIVSLA